MKTEINKRHDLALETQITQSARRIARGVGAIRKDFRKPLILLGSMALLISFWLLRYQILGYTVDNPLAPLYDHLTEIPLILLLLAVPIALFWAWGGPMQAGKIQDNLFRIGLTNSAGEPPMLLSITTDQTNPHIRIFEFYTCGIPVSIWLDCADKIAAALNVTVANIRYGTDNQHILLSAVPAATGFPKMLPWSDCHLPIDNSVYVLGKSLLGSVLVNLAKIPHILIGGSTGSGKSNLLKLLLYQGICKDAKLYVADFKGGADYGIYWEEHCSFSYDMNGLIVQLDEITKELEDRKVAFRKAGCKDIDEYRASCHPKTKRLIFACDEIAEVLDTTGLNKEQKEAVYQVINKLSVIARQGRAFGIHLFLATQRPDANIIPGQIRNNMDCKVCGRADSVLSSIIIDSTAAADLIPKDAEGRFILNDGTSESSGTVFQAYYFSKENL